MPFSGKERIKGTGKHQQSNILAAGKEEFLQKTESSFGKRIRDIPAMIVSVLPRSARFFLFSWLLCSLTVFPAPPLQADEVNVILIGGQSNATGQGYVNNIPPCFKTDKRILLYYSGSLKGTEPAEQLVPLSPASESPDRFGVELSLGTVLQKKFPQKNGPSSNTPGAEATFSGNGTQEKLLRISRGKNTSNCSVSSATEWKP